MSNTTKSQNNWDNNLVGFSTTYLGLNSPLLGKGDPLGFTDSGLDLAGRPRLKDGHIDIGCYQCWVNPPGMMMIIN